MLIPGSKYQLLAQKSLMCNDVPASRHTFSVGAATAAPIDPLPHNSPMHVNAPASFAPPAGVTAIRAEDAKVGAD